MRLTQVLAFFFAHSFVELGDSLKISDVRCSDIRVKKFRCPVLIPVFTTVKNKDSFIFAQCMCVLFPIDVTAVKRIINTPCLFIYMHI